VVDGYGLGVLRYAGVPTGKRTMVCGVELVAPTGDHDGSVGDVLYWMGRDNHCILTDPRTVKYAPPSVSQDADDDSSDEFDC
jgi:dynactin complex subunit